MVDEYCELFGCQVYGCKYKATGSVSIIVKGFEVIFYTCTEHTGESDILVKKLLELNEIED